MPQNVYISERIAPGIIWLPETAPSLVTNGVISLGMGGKLVSLQAGAAGPSGFRKLLQSNVAPHQSGVVAEEATYQLWYATELPDGEYILNVGGRTSRFQNLTYAVRVRHGRIDMLYGTTSDAKRYVEYPPERRTTVV